jgi:hypothetical protein
MVLRPTGRGEEPLSSSTFSGAAGRASAAQADLADGLDQGVRPAPAAEARTSAPSAARSCSSAKSGVDSPIEPTLYHQRTFGQPFQLDHIFVPKEWTAGMEVTEGTYTDWVAAKRSDHVPVIVDLAVPGVPGTAAAGN